MEFMIELGTRLNCFRPVMATCEQEAVNSIRTARTISDDFGARFILLPPFIIKDDRGPMTDD